MYFEDNACELIIRLTGESGDPSHNESNQVQMKGAGTVHFNEKVADQKVDTQTGPEKMLNKSYYGSGTCMYDPRDGDGWLLMRCRERQIVVE